MVQTDLTQLNRECSSWKEHLRNYRTELSDFRQRLQEAVSQPINKNDMPQVDHYHNQFDIQLSNINHLKHAIKEHERIASWELRNRNGNVSDATWAAHENLHDQYQVLEHTLVDLKEEFSSFVSRIG
jgi:predicted  nucleic acid-binding Zn-ribbon protein